MTVHSLDSATSVTDLLTLLPPLGREGALVRFRFGGHERILVNDLDSVHAVLANSDQEMRQSPASGPALRVMGDGLLTTRAAEMWRPRRILIQRELAPSRITSYAPLIASNTDNMIDSWGVGSEVSIRDAILTLALDNLGDSLFGSDFREFRSTVRTALDLMVELFDQAETGRVDIEAQESLEEAIDRLEQFVEAIVARREDNQSSRRFVVDVLIEAAQSDSPVFRDPFLRDEAVTLLMAGHDTVAFLMIMCLYLVNRDPEVRRRIAQEYEDASRAGVSAEEMPDRLPYARAAAQETLRLFPPLPFFNRTATEGLVLDGQKIEPGTLLMVSPWIIHRDERLFPVPETFDPGRFSPERRGLIPKGAYFPFGHGQRVCAGNHFALMQCVLVISKLASRVEFELDSTADAQIHCPVTLKFTEPVLATISTIRGSQPSLH